MSLYPLVKNQWQTDSLKSRFFFAGFYCTLKAGFLGPMPGIHQPQYLLVTTDCYSHYSTSANTVIPKFDQIFATYGIPVKIKTDNGPPFQSEEIDRYMKIWGIRHKRITPLWPPGNAEAESQGLVGTITIFRQCVSHIFYKKAIPYYQKATFL